MGRLRAGVPPANRPGIPPVIVTWADPAYLADFCKDIAALRPKVDILVPPVIGGSDASHYNI